jgi:hypothetical protein
MCKTKRLISNFYLFKYAVYAKLKFIFQTNYKTCTI